MRDPLADDKAITIGPAPKALAAMQPGKLFPIAELPSDIGLELRGCGARDYDSALKALERIADSLFMQIELERDVALALARIPRRCRGPRRPYPREAISLEFPTKGYDREPMELYWYGRQAWRMPLLQYLAYYQVIEYYYPKYGSGRGEREVDQLKKTLRANIPDSEIRAYLEKPKERRAFFSRQNVRLTRYPLPINDARTDMRDRVASRIYDIRCRIVHTKNPVSEENDEFLLPFAEAAHHLGPDIDFLQYIAQRVLIAAAAP